MRKQQGQDERRRVDTYYDASSRNATPRLDRPASGCFTVPPENVDSLMGLSPNLRLWRSIKFTIYGPLFPGPFRLLSPHQTKGRNLGSRCGHVGFRQVLMYLQLAHALLEAVPLTGRKRSLLYSPCLVAMDFSDPSLLIPSGECGSFSNEYDAWPTVKLRH